MPRPGLEDGRQVSQPARLLGGSGHAVRVHKDEAQLRFRSSRLQHWNMLYIAKNGGRAAVLQELGDLVGVQGGIKRDGYAAGGEDATPAAETAYIEQVRRTYYSGLIEAPAVISEANFTRYGASTTPTLVLIDRSGIVRTYHPGAMPYLELKAAVERAIHSGGQK